MSEHDTAAAPAALAPGTADRPVWLVPHPTHQWAQDVKAMARQLGLQVVDPAAAGPDELARAIVTGVPGLTLRCEGEAPIEAVATVSTAMPEEAPQPATAPTGPAETPPAADAPAALAAKKAGRKAT